MKNRLARWWRSLWEERLGWPADQFKSAFEDLSARLLIVEKRCEALTPARWLYREER